MEGKASRGVPWTFMSFAGSKLVAVATTLACSLPALRASKTDPIQALRYD